MFHISISAYDYVVACLLGKGKYLGRGKYGWDVMVWCGDNLYRHLWVISKWFHSERSPREEEPHASLKKSNNLVRILVTL